MVVLYVIYFIFMFNFIYNIFLYYIFVKGNYVYHANIIDLVVKSDQENAKYYSPLIKVSIDNQETHVFESKKRLTGDSKESVLKCINKNVNVVRYKKYNRIIFELLDRDLLLVDNIKAIIYITLIFLSLLFLPKFFGN